MLQILIRHHECKNNNSQNGGKKIAKLITQSETARVCKNLPLYAMLLVTVKELIFASRNFRENENIGDFASLKFRELNRNLKNPEST